jgi:membrane protease YdiL (CAAX protease family)
VKRRKLRSLLALALLVPVPSLGALAAFVWLPGGLGRALYVAGKLWILALASFYPKRLERPDFFGQRPWPAQLGRRLMLGLAVGAAMGATIASAHALWGDALIDADRLRSVLERAGFGTPGRYIALALCVTLVNSILEEWVWRRFVYRRCADLVSAPAAVLLSALFFTLHHAIAFRVEFGWSLALLGSLGVFTAGCVWSMLYASTRSLLPGWVSHVVADAVGLWIGWRILFG